MSGVFDPRCLMVGDSVLSDTYPEPRLVVGVSLSAEEIALQHCPPAGGFSCLLVRSLRYRITRVVRDGEVIFPLPPLKFKAGDLVRHVYGVFCSRNIRFVKSAHRAGELRTAAGMPFAPSQEYVEFENNEGFEYVSNLELAPVPVIKKDASVLYHNTKFIAGTGHESNGRRHWLRYLDGHDSAICPLDSELTPVD